MMNIAEIDPSNILTQIMINPDQYVIITKGRFGQTAFAVHSYRPSTRSLYGGYYTNDYGEALGVGLSRVESFGIKLLMA